MISILIPFFNEKENISILKEKLLTVLKQIGDPYEIIFVNDGSTDIDVKHLTIADEQHHVKLISHRRQMGKGKALHTAFNHAQGDIIIFMDADLEDNPEEIPHFVNKIKEGYDLVNGARQGRKHNPIIKFYSSLANRFIKKFLKSPFTDINCGFKAMKRSVLEEITLYGNNFRFLPLGAFYEGFKVTEIPVQHTKRIYGQSKFGTGKIFYGFIDTMSAYFIYRFAERPLHFFGIVGGSIFSLGSLILLVLGIERILFQHALYRRPILFLGMLLVIVGVQIAATGLIAELVVYMHKRRK